MQGQLFIETTQNNRASEQQSVKQFHQGDGKKHDKNVFRSLQRISTAIPCFNLTVERSMPNHFLKSDFVSPHVIKLNMKLNHKS